MARCYSLTGRWILCSLMASRYGPPAARCGRSDLQSQSAAAFRSTVPTAIRPALCLQGVGWWMCVRVCWSVRCLDWVCGKEWVRRAPPPCCALEVSLTACDIKLPVFSSVSSGSMTEAAVHTCACYEVGSACGPARTMQHTCPRPYQPLPIVHTRETRWTSLGPATTAKTPSTMPAAAVRPCAMLQPHRNPTPATPLLARPCLPAHGAASGRPGPGTSGRSRLWLAAAAASPHATAVSSQPELLEQQSSAGAPPVLLPPEACLSLLSQVADACQAWGRAGQGGDDDDGADSAAAAAAAEAAGREQVLEDIYEEMEELYYSKRGCIIPKAEQHLVGIVWGLSVVFWCSLFTGGRGGGGAGSDGRRGESGGGGPDGERDERGKGGRRAEGESPGGW